jgi:hypothetical protein
MACLPKLQRRHCLTYPSDRKNSDQMGKFLFLSSTLRNASQITVAYVFSVKLPSVDEFYLFYMFRKLIKRLERISLLRKVSEESGFSRGGCKKRASN